MEVTKRDVLKHYLCSLLVYGVVLGLLFVMPMFNQNIENPYFNYLTVLSVYYILYVVFACPFLMRFKPKSVLSSRNVLIVEYFKRQFKNLPLDEKLSLLNMSDDEKQAFVILFIKAFFGSYFLSLLCNKYIIQLDYNIDFLSAIVRQSFSYVETSGIWNGIIQYIDDTADVWLNLMFTVVSFVYALSYLTESKLLKNEINYADTSFLGIFSCIICYYPFVIISEKVIPVAMKDLIPVENTFLRIFIYVLVIIANLFIMISVLRLGTKSGNLTNRGIVTGFPYNIVRHPEYSMRIFYIILTFIPMYFLGELKFWGYVILPASMLMWISIYVLRAITEERNLIKDEKYRNYVQRVKYRFIPFIV